MTRTINQSVPLHSVSTSRRQVPDNLMTTVALYFPLNTGAAEREAESAVAFIRSDFFLVPNLQGVCFFDPSGKPLEVPDSDNRPADLTYYTFPSVVTAAIIDNRARIHYYQ